MWRDRDKDLDQRFHVDGEDVAVSQNLARSRVHCAATAVAMLATRPPQQGIRTARQIRLQRPTTTIRVISIAGQVVHREALRKLTSLGWVDRTQRRDGPIHRGPGAALVISRPPRREAHSPWFGRRSSKPRQLRRHQPPRRRSVRGTCDRIVVTDDIVTARCLASPLLPQRQRRLRSRIASAFSNRD